jgi:hypothetical protein
LGFGSEEDSLTSVYSLMPSPPKKDIIKMYQKDKEILLFNVKLISTQPTDYHRGFALEF